MLSGRLLGVANLKCCPTRFGGFISVRSMESLVSTAWLADRLKNSGHDFRVVHASWEKCKDYQNGHIPGAVCFDGEYCKDQKSPYKNMLPKPEEFAEYVGKQLGIDNNMDVVIYDSNSAAPSVLYAARVWWMFRVFGHDRVAIMNGGLKRWMGEKREVTDQVPKIKPTNFTSNFRRELVLYYEDVLDKAVQKNSVQLVDARPADQFKGIGKSPAGKSGRIPNAMNVPVQSVIHPESRLFIDKAQLEEIFKNGGVRLDQPMATSCNTGMTASGLAFAAYLLGKKDVPVYDGSWYEWAQRSPDKYIVKENE